MKRALPPDGGLKEPVRPFSETFSAEELILHHFFRDLASKQKRLGSEFERVLYDNICDLYISD